MRQAGRIAEADRLQRLTIGVLLMMLTLSKSFELADWRTVLALVLQAELLITGLAGWCPIYWGCSVAGRSRTTHN